MPGECNYSISKMQCKGFVMTILFYPEPLLPTPLSRVYRVINEVDWIKYHNNPKESYDLHIFWSYTKLRITPDEFTLNAKDCINRGCWDIGKERVNDIFNDIRVNPTTYNGVCVEKRDLQGRHAFHGLVRCPTQARDGFVYQRYIENRENGLYYKYRVYFADGINYVLKSYKSSVFGSECTRHDVIPKEELFSFEQEQDFLEKCKVFGIDFGEFDIMWDDKPIVVDVNNVIGGGFVSGLTGTKLHADIDQTFLTFLKKRHKDKIGMEVS